MEWQSYKPGDVIFRESDESDAAYLIISGDVRIVSGYGRTDSKELAVVGAGEYIGEMGAIDNQARSASAIAKDNVVCAPVAPAAWAWRIASSMSVIASAARSIRSRLRCWMVSTDARSSSSSTV